MIQPLAGLSTCGASLERVQPLPVCRRVRTVHRVRVIEPVVAAWHELRVQIGDIAVRIGIDGVVGGIGSNSMTFMNEA